MTDEKEIEIANMYARWIENHLNEIKEIYKNKISMYTENQVDFVHREMKKIDIMALENLSNKNYRLYLKLAYN